MNELDDVDVRIRRAMATLAEEIEVTAPDPDARLDALPARSRRRVMVAAAAAAVVVAAGLVVVRIDGGPQTLRTTDGNGCEAQLRGAVYLVGDSGLLYRGSLCPFGFQVVPGVTDARSVTGNDSTVLVRTGSQGIDRVVAGALQSMPSGYPAASGAAVSPDGVVAFTTSQPVQGSTPVPRLHIFDPAAGTTRVLFSDSAFLSSPSWGPEGEVAVFRQSALGDEPPEIMVVGRDGQARHFIVDLQIGQHLEPLWGPSGLIAAGYQVVTPELTAATLLLDPRSGEKRVVEGWHPMAWSPDGRELLVQRDGDDRPLAVASAPAFDRPRDLGRSPSGATGGLWLDCSTSSPCDAPSQPRPAADTENERLSYDSFLQLVDRRRIRHVDVHEREPRLRGTRIADDGTDRDFAVSVPASTTTAEVVQLLLDARISVTIHD